MKKLFSTRYSDTSFSLGILLMRATFGVLIIPHGYNKLVHFGTLSSTFSDPFHVGSAISLILVITAEFFCGILLVLGLGTRLAAFVLVINMIVVVFKAQHADFLGKAELPTLYLAGFFMLMLVGAGRFSLDRLIWK